ncbi:MAG: protein kinase [Leptospiraceae bacterium]|nr:protein kinase [Leptospiraceae bacterium]
MPDFNELIPAAFQRQKFAIARLISLFEDPRPEAALQRKKVLDSMQSSGQSRRGLFLGFTGTPGAGKSTLVGELANRFISDAPDKCLAVLAVDPSSHVSGGSILGDRTRVRFSHGDDRLYFRSQASDQELGGISRTTFSVLRLLYHLFDVIIVETVGIGQSEIEIQQTADRVFLLLQPMAGDQIQFMKAGIMEIPDCFIINKSDEKEAAERTFHALRASLQLIRPGEARVPIFRTSAITGMGLADLLDYLKNLMDGRDDPVSLDASLYRREVYYFEKWVKDELGRSGLRMLSDLGGSRDLMDRAGGFDGAQKAILEAVQHSLTRLESQVDSLLEKS